MHYALAKYAPHGGNFAIRGRWIPTGRQRRRYGLRLGKSKTIATVHRSCSSLRDSAAQSKTQKITERPMMTNSSAQGNDHHRTAPAPTQASLRRDMLPIPD